MPGLLRAFVLLSFHGYVWACFWQLSGARRTPEDDAVVLRFGRVLGGGRTAYRLVRGPVALTRRIVGARR